MRYGKCHELEKEQRKKYLIFETFEDDLMFLKLLRNFGHTMVDIEIHFPKHWKHLKPCSRANDKFDIYLAKYCTESLKNLFIIGSRIYDSGFKNLFEDIEKPFPNVTNLVIRFCVLRPKLFKKFFPNVQYLCLKYNYHTSFSVVQEHLPNLKTLSYIPFDVKCSELSYEGIGIDMLKLNPQLESLCLYLHHEGEFVSKLVQCITEYLPGLKFFSILSSEGISPDYHMMGTFSPLKTFNFNNHGPFIFDNVVDFHLAVHGPANINLFTFNNLQRVTFSADMNLDDTHLPILEFISRQKNLKSIQLYGYVSGNLDRLFESEHVLSNIVELNVFMYIETVHRPHFRVMCSILRFLKRSRSIEKLVIKAVIHMDSFDGELNAIESHNIEYKIISDHIIRCKCGWCRYKSYQYKSMELPVEKTADSTLMKFICTLRDENNLNPPCGRRSFHVIECMKTENEPSRAYDRELPFYPYPIY